MVTTMRSLHLALLIGVLMSLGLSQTKNQKTSVTLSDETQACIDCHRGVTPGIVEDWLTSRHAQTTPAEALKKTAFERRISNEAVPDGLRPVAVGCYECHSQHPADHRDNFDHFGYRINVVVSPNDCATCHRTEADQYADGKKAHAYGNLEDNAVYQTLVRVIDGVKRVDGMKVHGLDPTPTTKHETCYACHGTKVGVEGMMTMTTSLGDIEVPKLTNWPNQGVGRVNPDGSLGACTACHPRHSFSIAVARKPFTCAQCHLEPDVPAWDIYRESKHGNIILSQEGQQHWDAVPWKIGTDLRAPTCATCHSSLLVSPDGDVRAERTHNFSARLWTRIFGLIYSHPQPKSGNTAILRNADGLPLPTTFGGQHAADGLIGAEEQAHRKDAMTHVCQGCHSSAVTEGYFGKFAQTSAEADSMVLAATNLVRYAWEKKIADPANPFDEMIEQLWVKEWLFYANSVRYASAMSGPDYASFENGWWELSHTLEEMRELLERHGAEEK